MRLHHTLLSLVIICGLFSCLFITIPIGEARDYLFTVQSSLDITAEPNDFGNVNPGATVTGTVTITYKHNRFARPQGFPLPNRKSPTTINLSIINPPEWCTVSLEEQSLNAPIDSFFQDGSISLNTTISVSMQQDAPAFDKGTFTIQADANNNGNILESSNSLPVDVKPSFQPNLAASLSNTSISLVPNQQNNITVTVENTGNAAMMVEVTTDTISRENYSLTLPTAQRIEIDGQKEFIINIKANEDIDKDQNYTELFTVSSYAVDSETSEASPIILSLSIDLLGESVDEDVLDLTPYILGLFIAFVIIFVIISLIAWKRR